MHVSFLKLIFVCIFITTLSMAIEWTAPINSDVHWTLDNSPYVLPVGLTVLVGGTLTVHPGVNIQCPGGIGLYLYGDLNMLGTADQPIVMNHTGGTTWDFGVKVVGSGVTIVMTHTTIRWFVSPTASPSVTEQGILFDASSNTTLSHCRLSALYLTLYGWLAVRNSYFESLFTERHSPKPGSVYQYVTFQGVRSASRTDFQGTGRCEYCVISRGNVVFFGQWSFVHSLFRVNTEYVSLDYYQGAADVISGSMIRGNTHTFYQNQRIVNSSIVGGQYGYRIWNGGPPILEALSLCGHSSNWSWYLDTSNSYTLPTSSRVWYGTNDTTLIHTRVRDLLTVGGVGVGIFTIPSETISMTPLPSPIHIVPTSLDFGEAAGNGVSFERHFCIANNNDHAVTATITTTGSSAFVFEAPAPPSSAFTMNSCSAHCYIMTCRPVFGGMLYDTVNIALDNGESYDISLSCNGIAATQPPSKSPTLFPTHSPTLSPTHYPSTSPSVSPTDAPSVSPSIAPTDSPSLSPTDAPSTSPSKSPTNAPTTTPTDAPSLSPSLSPTDSPSTSPSKAPTDAPSMSPTDAPSISPSVAPTDAPSTSPTHSPSTSPTMSPTGSPTTSPSVAPTHAPTTDAPTTSPTTAPSPAPTMGYSGPTNVSALLLTDTTWTLSRSPYFLKDGAARVFPGVRLVIEAGVVIETEVNGLLIDGELSIEGTQSQKVVIRQLGTSGYGIRINAGTNTINHCTIEGTFQYGIHQPGGGYGVFHGLQLVNSGFKSSYVPLSLTSFNINGLFDFYGHNNNYGTISEGVFSSTSFTCWKCTVESVRINVLVANPAPPQSSLSFEGPTILKRTYISGSGNIKFKQSITIDDCVIPSGAFFETSSGNLRFITNTLLMQQLTACSFGDCNRLIAKSTLLTSLPVSTTSLELKEVNLMSGLVMTTAANSAMSANSSVWWGSTAASYINSKITDAYDLYTLGIFGNTASTISNVPFDGDMRVFPSLLLFAPTSVGDVSYTRTACAANHLITSVDIDGITFSGTSASSYQLVDTLVFPITVGAGSVRCFDIRFVPVSVGPHNATVEVLSNGATYECQLQGEGGVPPPTLSPSKAPTRAPTVSPTDAPSMSPSVSPTDAPSQSPSISPTNTPTVSPTDAPSTSPTASPTDEPTTSPTDAPSTSPSVTPTSAPSVSPTDSPTRAPTITPYPTRAPSELPSASPTLSPTDAPIATPTHSPTHTPSLSPTTSPTNSPSVTPTSSPSTSPTNTPSTTPSRSPTRAPNLIPTTAPSTSPTHSPTTTPSRTPTHTPSKTPTSSPTSSPTTSAPTHSPSLVPTQAPTPQPTLAPCDISCTSRKPVPCRQWTCHPSTGECQSPQVTDYSPCDDNDDSTVRERCWQGICKGLSRVYPSARVQFSLNMQYPSSQNVDSVQQEIRTLVATALNITTARLQVAIQSGSIRVTVLILPPSNAIDASSSPAVLATQLETVLQAGTITDNIYFPSLDANTITNDEVEMEYCNSSGWVIRGTCPSESGGSAFNVYLVLLAGATICMCVTVLWLAVRLRRGSSSTTGDGTADDVGGGRKMNRTSSSMEVIMGVDDNDNTGGTTTGGGGTGGADDMIIPAPPASTQNRNRLVALREMINREPSDALRAQLELEYAKELSLREAAIEARVNEQLQKVIAEQAKAAQKQAEMEEKLVELITQSLARGATTVPTSALMELGAIQSVYQLGNSELDFDLSIDDTDAPPQPFNTNDYDDDWYRHQQQQQHHNADEVKTPATQRGDNNNDDGILPEDFDLMFAAGGEDEPGMTSGHNDDQEGNDVMM